jgi:ribosomal protein S18 acetylase RimI-like enzyme
MELDIRPLTPELRNDYLYFFDNIAFADHPEWSQCYCLAFHFEPAWDAVDADKENPWRERAVRFVREGKIQGYLAYSDGKTVGWCNANDKKNYAALESNVKPEIWGENEDKKIKSIVCFLVAPDMRGRGIATKLLDHVCVDAEADGYDFIESYPPAGKSDMYTAHHGTIALNGYLLHSAHVNFVYNKADVPAVFSKQTQQCSMLFNNC